MAGQADGFDERAAARALSGGVASPTLVLLAVLFVGHWSIAAVALLQGGTGWWATLPLGLSAYAHYTLVHESVHANVLPRTYRSRDRVHDAIGWYGSFVLLATWPMLRRTHQRHHAHVNGPDDPDLFVHGPLRGVIGMSALLTIGLSLPLIVLKPIVPRRWRIASYLHADEAMTRGEAMRHFGLQGCVVACLWAAALLGHGGSVLALAVLPAAIGRTLLGILFQWWPHAPFERTDRFGATRNGLRGWHWPTLFQNHHLVHHLWPSVPWYRYRRLHAALAPILAENGKT